LTQQELKKYRDLLDVLPPNSPEVEKIKILFDEDKKERCRNNFLPFVREMWGSFIAGKHHKDMAEAFERVAEGSLKRLIINMPPRHDIAINEEIPTLLGWKRIKDIMTGDYVFAPNGIPVLVTGKSAVNQKPTYIVTTSDGATLRVSEDHLWTVRFQCEVNAPYKTYSTLALYERQQKYPNTSKPPKLPQLSPLQYQNVKLPIDPYVLGVWLGDGSSSGASIGCSYADMPDMRRQIEDCGYSTTHNPKFQQFNVLGLHKQLRELWLLNNKHIPEQYLCASIEQRIALLQGLIDTDGDVTKEGKVTFNQTDLKLTEQVLCLIHSLGVKARITNRQTNYNGIPSQPSHRIMFKLTNAARIPRKASGCKALQGNWARTIHIHPTGLVESTQCLQVANEDGLFVAGRGHLVTHNTKSEFASFLFPAWFLGRFPEKKIIQTAHTAELAVGFGRKVRNLVATSDYQGIFPTKLSSDSKAAGRWNTHKGGDYFAIGVGGAVTGKGADVLIIDDPHSEQEAMQGTATVYDRVYEWYNSGPRQRLQPGGAIIIVMTRWSKKDLTGQILANAAKRDGDTWEVIEFPALMPSGKPLWAEFWSQKELEAIKAELPVSKWEAQYQQNPTSEEGAIIKREMWKRWESDIAPEIEYTIQSWDTAFEKNNRADYSACTTWGIFYIPNDKGERTANIILLEAIKERMEFPELKVRAMQQWKEWNPDTLIVEKKAAGAPLIYEMRRMGIPISEYTPSKGSDKIARVNAISDLFASGMVWCPDTRWADEVMEECASFPNGDHDDLVDSTSQALLRFRQGGFIRLQSDEEEEVHSFKRKVVYY
jgi:predicted phage terminase large subunit-like protein